MKEKQLLIEDGREREVIKIVCDICDGNPHGYRLGYRDTLKEGEVEFEAEVIRTRRMR